MDNTPVTALSLSLDEEKFALEVARHNDVRLAWRTVTGRHDAPARIALLYGSQMLDRPGVAQRIEQIRLQAADVSNVQMATVLNYWWQLAQADPSEIVQLRRLCCRYCWGFDHAYCWTPAEYEKACEDAIRQGQDAPSCAGGIDFDHTRAPSPDCPECAGEGVLDLHMRDTRNLSQPGRLLFAGVERNKYGVKVHLRDQHAAVNDLARFFGMFQDRIQVSEVVRPVGQGPETVEDLGALSVDELMRRLPAMLGKKA